MEGSVSWTAKGWDSGHGAVTTCKQDDARLHIAFTCEHVGEGQMTLAFTTQTQFASARFVYEGTRERTYAGVVGRLSWQPGSLQFEGQWDDQDDDVVWSFSLDIDGFDCATGTTDGAATDPEMTSLDEILGTLDRRYLTDWFAPEVAPDRPGIYRVKPRFSASGSLAYAAWNGAGWSDTRRRVDDFGNLLAPRYTLDSARPWRGLTDDGAQRVALLLDGVQQRDSAYTNTDLLARLRQDEAEVERARAAAHAVHQKMRAQIDSPGQEPTTRQALRDALDQVDQVVGADFDAPADPAFDETVARSLEDTHAHLLAARATSAARAGYWRRYWDAIVAMHPAFADVLTSKGLLAGYGKDMQARLGKHASMQPLPGSFGTKRRR